MKEHTFTYLLQADSNTDTLVERLGEAGCDDALIGTGRPDHIALEFTRAASSAEIAMASALADVQLAIPSAQLLRPRFGSHRLTMCQA